MRTFARLVSAALSLLLVSCGSGSESSDGDSSNSGGSRPSTREEKDADIVDAHRLRNLGKVHAERDSTEGYIDASRYLLRLVDLGKAVALDHLNLAKVLVFAAKVEPAAEHLEKARALYGESPPMDLHYIDGLIKKRLGRHEEAVAALSKVTEADRSHTQVWYQRAHQEFEAKRFEDAEKSLRTLLELHPKHRAGNFKLSEVLRRLGRKEEAAAQFKIFRSMPEDTAERNLEKCILTQVTLRPMDREQIEPPRTKLEWREVTDRVFGGAVVSNANAAIAIRTPDRTELAILGPDGVRRVSSGGSQAVAPNAATPLEKAAGAVDGIVADVDNDGARDLALLVPHDSGAKDVTSSPAFGNELRLFLGTKTGAWTYHSTIATVAAPGALTGLAAVDVDHDGDLDFVVQRLLAAGEETEVQPWLLRNNGDRNFTRLQPFGGATTVPATARIRVDAHDVDQANDVDLVLSFGGESGVVFLNQRDGTFDPVSVPELAGMSHVIVEDFTGDGAPDIFASHLLGWTLVENGDPLGKPYSFRVGDASSQELGSDRMTISDACAADIDNDGDLDVLLVTSAGLQVLRNSRGGVLEPEEQVPGHTAVRVTTADLTGDGLLEAVLVSNDGDVKVLASGSDPAYASWTVFPKGVKDNVAAIGAVVEQFAGRLYQSRMIKSANGLHLGLGRANREEIDGLRVRWPQGIVQSIASGELEVDDRGAVSFRQKAGLVASCPFLYAYGPDGWHFVTDVLGIAPLDEWLPPGATPHKDPEEFVRIEGDALRVVDGKLRLSITEELRETAYLDRLELVVVEHDADREVFLDESSRQGMYDPLALTIVRDDHLQAPSECHLEHGGDALAKVSRRDRDFAHGYPNAPTQWGGWVPRYDIDITAPRRAAAILLTGRIAWYDSTVVYSLWQHGRKWGALRVERDGETLVEDLGVPAGMDRTMVASFGSASVEKGQTIRLSGHHRFLWDRILFAQTVESIVLDGRADDATTPAGTALTVRTHAVSSATLRFHGYSRIVGDKERHEQSYAFDEAAPDDTYAPAMGRATRYGDVKPLLLGHDDLLVVIPCGDRVDFEFDAPPAIEEGKQRTYFLRTSGWAKEASFHNRSGRWVEPLPVRGMRTYPPTDEETRRDEEYQRYLREYQTREIRRRPL